MRGRGCRRGKVSSRETRVAKEGVLGPGARKNTLRSHGSKAKLVIDAFLSLIGILPLTMLREME